MWLGLYGLAATVPTGGCAITVVATGNVPASAPSPSPGKDLRGHLCLRLVVRTIGAAE